MVTVMTDVEAQILRNQLAMMRRDINLLNGRLDTPANRERRFLREQILATARLLEIPEEEAL